MDFAVSAQYKVKLKENEKRETSTWTWELIFFSDFLSSSW